MIEYLLGEPIYISDTEKVFKYRVKENIHQGSVLPMYKYFINSRISSTFKECEFINLQLDYLPKNKNSKGFLDDFINDNSLEATGKIDIIIDNLNFETLNNRFCVREVKTGVTLIKEKEKYYWKIKINNYDIFDKLEEKVNNILPILSYCDLYEKEIGISLTTEKNKVKMILDFYLNLLDKNKKDSLSEQVRKALLYL